jgi:hypothetical protein
MPGTVDGYILRVYGLLASATGAATVAKCTPRRSFVGIIALGRFPRVFIGDFLVLNLSAYQVVGLAFPLRQPGTVISQHAAGEK